MFRNSYIKYIKYILKHKIGVYLAGRKLKVSVWQLLVHDLSKFSLAEFDPYRRMFYTVIEDAWAKEEMQNNFNIAWLHHIHKNKHHWNYWIYNTDGGGVQVIRMPEKYIREMVADWMGVSYAKGKPMSEAVAWYLQHKDTLVLHPVTRKRVEALLKIGEPSANYSVEPFPKARKPGS